MPDCWPVPPAPANEEAPGQGLRPWFEHRPPSPSWMTERATDLTSEL